MKLKLNGHDVDLAKALPLTLGDLEDLESQGLINEQGEMNVTGPKRLIDLLFHLAAKAEPEVKREHMRDVPVGQMGPLGDWAKKALTEEPKKNRPS